MQFVEISLCLDAIQLFHVLVRQLLCEVLVRATHMLYREFYGYNLGIYAWICGEAILHVLSNRAHPCFAPGCGP